MLAVTTPIDFANNITKPVGIKHPVANDNSHFKVKEKGIYLISWTVNIKWDDAPKNLISLNLFNISTNQPLFSSEETFDLAPTAGKGRYEILSGQILVPLKAKDVISLQVQPSNVTTTITGALFNIIKISD